MATFLALSRDVARESGTLPASSIGDVATVTGRPASVVGWVREAWIQIQNRHPDWRWMTGEFEHGLAAGQQRFSGVVDFSLPRWDSFAVVPGERLLTIGQTALGAVDEGPLAFVADWPAFYNSYLTGASREFSGRPIAAAIDDAGLLVVWPKPESAYTLRGFYRKAPQELAANGDVPDMPAKWHALIKWNALLLMGTYDEAVLQQQYWRAEFQRMLSELEIEQRPPITLSGNFDGSFA